jgi:hypothetical protein
MILSQIIRILAAVACIVFAINNEKTIYSQFNTDGFTNQMIYIRMLLDMDVDISDFSDLGIVHLIRYVSSAPLNFFDEQIFFGASSLIVILLMVPIFIMQNNVKWIMLSCLLLVVYSTLSLRTTLIVCGIGYIILYIYKNEGNLLYLIFSFFFVNLSSGSVIVALCVVFSYSMILKKFNIGLGIYSLMCGLSLMPSILDKFEGFSLGQAGYAPTDINAGGFLSVLSRSTIYTSFYEGQFYRGVAYSIFALSAVFIMIYAMMNYKYRGYSIIFMTSFVAFFFEGQGVLALTVPTLLFLAGVPLPFGQNTRMNTHSGDSTVDSRFRLQA